MLIKDDQNSNVMDENKNESQLPLLENERTSKVSQELDQDQDEEDVSLQNVNFRDARRQAAKLRSENSKTSSLKMVVFAVISGFLLVLTLSTALYFGVVTTRKVNRDWLNGLSGGWSKVYNKYSKAVILFVL